MNKDATFNAGLGGQLRIAQASEGLRQGLATFKALRGHWHSLNTPVAAEIIGVYYVDGQV